MKKVERTVVRTLVPDMPPWFLSLSIPIPPFLCPCLWIEPELELEVEVVPLSCSELLVALVAGEGVCTTNILEEKKRQKRGH